MQTNRPDLNRAARAAITGHPPVSPARAILATRPTQADRGRCATPRPYATTGQGFASLNSGADDMGVC